MSDVTSQRLEQIREELAGILEARLSELNEIIRGTESVTRRIVAAEVEVERHRGTALNLQGEMTALREEVGSAEQRVEAVRKEHSLVRAQYEEARTELRRTEEEVSEERAQLQATRGRVQALEGEAEELRNENTSLKAKLRTLEDNIARMRRLKEELMSSISGLTQQMTGLAGGTD